MCDQWEQFKTCEQSAHDTVWRRLFAPFTLLRATNDGGFVLLRWSEGNTGHMNSTRLMDSATERTEDTECIHLNLGDLCGKSS